MSSILTNTSAMTALQTLRGINADLSKTQDMISTGKRVATAKDNAAIFAISKVMESDVAGFKAISESLSLGASTIAVASNASNQIGEVLTEIKSKIVAANEGNVDRTTIQNEIDQLSDQIRGVVGAAQFNGLNLLQNGGENVDVLASLDRGANGGVSSSFITVNGRDFTESAGTFGSAGAVQTTSLNSAEASALTSATDTLTFSTGIGVGAAQALELNFGGTTVRVENTTAGVLSNDASATATADAINAAGIAGLSAVADGADVNLTYSGTNALTNSDNLAGITAAMSATLGGFAASSASTTANASSGQVTFAGNNGAVGERVVLRAGDQEVTVTLSAAAGTPAALETQVLADYALLNPEDQFTGITLSALGTGDGIVFTNNTTEEIDFSVDVSGLGTAGTATPSGSPIAAADASAVNFGIAGGTVNEGDSFRVSIGGEDYEYIAGLNETVNDVAYGLQSVIAASGPADIQVSVIASSNSATEAATLVINSALGRTVTGADGSGGEATGDLYGLSQIDVTSTEGARAALSNIESLIGTMTRAQADFGASERRVELQSKFMSSLIDSFKAGIGGLVDSDMEAASARLQALQVQQQLAVQSLSIANQAPQTILSLFR